MHGIRLHALLGALGGVHLDSHAIVAETNMFMYTHTHVYIYIYVHVSRDACESWEHTAWTSQEVLGGLVESYDNHYHHYYHHYN